MNNQKEQNQMEYGNGYGYGEPQLPYGNGNKTWRDWVSASMLLGILSAVLLACSLFLPAIDFSYYHESIKLRYSIIKICENVGLISDMWRGIPIGILIAAGLMLLLSFSKIPPWKAVPCMIVLCMIILAIADIGNVVAWINKLLQQTIGFVVAKPKTSIHWGIVLKSFQAGIYVLAAGLVSGIISCFVSISKRKSTP